MTFVDNSQKNPSCHSSISSFLRPLSSFPLQHDPFGGLASMLGLCQVDARALYGWSHMLVLCFLAINNCPSIVMIVVPCMGLVCSPLLGFCFSMLIMGVCFLWCACVYLCVFSYEFQSLKLKFFFVRNLHGAAIDVSTSVKRFIYCVHVSYPILEKEERKYHIIS